MRDDCDVMSCDTHRCLEQQRATCVCIVYVLLCVELGVCYMRVASLHIEARCVRHAPCVRHVCDVHMRDVCANRRHAVSVMVCVPRVGASRMRCEMQVVNMRMRNTTRGRVVCMCAVWHECRGHARCRYMYERQSCTCTTVSERCAT